MWNRGINDQQRRVARGGRGRRPTWRRWSSIGAVVLLTASPAALAHAQPNVQTTLILHAISHDAGNDCFTPEDQGFDCSDGGRANVSVTPFSEVDIYLYVRNYDSLRGVQCAFSWPVEWQLHYWGPPATGGCQSGQVYAVQPQSPGGPTAGTVTTAFDCIAGGFLAAMGSLRFTVGNTGCLAIVDSSYPFGTHVVGCDSQPTEVAAAGWGQVCTDDQGVDTCDAQEPVLPATWGHIKAGYRR
jgi:hypothetical protein